MKETSPIQGAASGAILHALDGVCKKNTKRLTKISADEAKKDHAAGILARRLNADSLKEHFPTFADVVKMWNLKN